MNANFNMNFKISFSDPPFKAFTFLRFLDSHFFNNHGSIKKDRELIIN